MQVAWLEGISLLWEGLGWTYIDMAIVCLSDFTINTVEAHLSIERRVPTEPTLYRNECTHTVVLDSNEVLEIGSQPGWLDEVVAKESGPNPDDQYCDCVWD